MDITGFRFFWSMIVAFCFMTTILANSTQRECITDADCTEKGKFCHEFHCTSCVPCTILNRQPPAKSSDGNRCAATAESCGPCSPGYQPEEIKGALRFLMRTYRCERVSGTPFRIEVLFGSLMLVAVAIVLCILFIVWRDSRQKRESKQVIVDTDSIELVHTSRCGYENPITSEETELAGRTSSSSKESSSPISDSGSTVIVHDDEDKPTASFLSSGISTGSYEVQESPISQASNSVRMSSTNFVVVPVEQEALVLAVPIGSYHIPNAENDATLTEVIVLPTDEIRAVMESNNWMSRSDSRSSSEPELPREIPITTAQVRFLSQDNLAQSSPTVGKRGTSDPQLNQNGYANVLVSLNTHRTVPVPCAATSDGIDEPHTKATSFSSAPHIARSYERIYPALSATPIPELIPQVTVNIEPEGDCQEKVEELSAHVFLSSEDTIPKSSRNSACLNDELIINSSKKTKSQPLPTSKEECESKHSRSCPHLMMQSSKS